MGWHGNIPTHWEKRKIAELFLERREKVSDTDYEPLSVSKGGIVPQIATVAKSNDGDNRKLVMSGDFAINSRSDRRGSSGISNYDGSVSLINIVLTPREEVNGHYLHYLLRSHYFIEEYYRNGRGIVADLWTTRYTEMKNIQIPVPSRTEQGQIVRYLDRKLSTINKLIEGKKRQIALLQEKKTTAINEAVNQLDNGWEIRRLASLGTFRKGFGGSRADDDPNGVPCIRYGDIYRSASFTMSVPITRIKEMVRDTYARAYKDELLFALSGETKEEIGRAMVNEIDEDTWASGDAAIFAPNKDVVSRYLSYSLSSAPAIQQRATLSRGDIIVHIYVSELKQLLIPLPSLSEQDELVKYLDKLCGSIEKIIDDSEQEIMLITEYRVRLISDVVTGAKQIMEEDQ